MRMRSVVPASLAVRRMETTERNPAIDHTADDTNFGLMPVMRARSTFVADARTASPNAVCPSSHHRPNVMSGTTMSTRIWLADTSMSRNGVHVPENGSGNSVCSDPVRYSGSASVTAWHSCATPIVATRTMTRGDLNSRRITASSMMVPVSVPKASAANRAGQ